MKKPFREFHGKIMLFGEYSIMEGSSAALIPYPAVYARLKFPIHKPDEEATQSNHTLRSLSGYLSRNPECQISINLREFENDVAEGLYMDSNIPQNRGLGSSGAICAALFDAYKADSGNNATRGDLRAILAGIESYFHGTSSGVDPLCIYLSEPVIVHKERYYLQDKSWQIQKNKLQLFLTDTGKASQTKPLVQHFRDRMKQIEFAMKFTQLYNPLIDRAVNQWKIGELQKETVFAISKAQIEYLEAMIPMGSRKIWDEGLYGGLYAMKLCGSGGGGMMLGFTDNPEATEICIREKFGIGILNL